MPERFFGFGNGSSEHAESDYTAHQGLALLRLAYRLQPTLDIAYIDDTYPFMLPQERDRFVGALRAAALLEK